MKAIRSRRSKRCSKWPAAGIRQPSAENTSRRVTGRPGSSITADPFLLLLAAEGLPEPWREYVFAPERRFRADYCWLSHRTKWFGVIVEKNGGVWHKGGHSSPKGILRDWEKSNLAQTLGYIYLQYSPQQLLLPATIQTLKELLL